MTLIHLNPLPKAAKKWSRAGFIMRAILPAITTSTRLKEKAL